MIDSKNELKRYLHIEMSLYGDSKKRFIPFSVSEQQMCLKYCIRLRKTEYYLNTGKKTRFFFSKLMLSRLQVKTGIIINCNTCGAGLSIAHMGPIIINGGARIGENLRIHVGVIIGANNGFSPVIGSNCYIGPGAKIFGNVKIADSVSIGAGAVVTKDCLEKDGVYVGVPASLIKRKNDYNSN